jgi:aryl-alcohol dehydrogenase-like predicted oxidoreductase
MLRDEILPTFFDLRDEGKIRYIGCSEMFGEDTTHEMLRHSLPDDVWDVVMVGFNILNQTARQHVFPLTMQQNVAVQIMFAVRRALSRPQRLVEVLQELIEFGELDPADIDMANPLGFVLDESDAPTLTDAAYRFVRYEPGVDVVLSGTGNPAHLQANIESISRPPLPAGVVDKLRTIFRHAYSVTGG